jgi:fructose-1,6-bisphosphatase/inositol monophosphatase family enzyme
MPGRTRSSRSRRRSPARRARSCATRFARVGDLRIATKSTATDLVSEADVAAERLIRERLAAARPDDGMLGEEGSDLTGSSGLRWVVDPLDGTVNFLFGIPQWCVSIAVEDADGAVAGVVFDALRDELWTATRDGPPVVNGEPVSRAERTELGHRARGHGLRLRRGRPARAGRGDRPAAAARARRAPARLGRARSRLDGRRPLRRLLRARSEPLGPRRGRADLRAPRASRSRPLPAAAPSGPGVLVASAALTAALRPLLD